MRVVLILILLTHYVLADHGVRKWVEPPEVWIEFYPERGNRVEMHWLSQGFDYRYSLEMWNEEWQMWETIDLVFEPRSLGFELIVDWRARDSYKIVLVHIRASRVRTPKRHWFWKETGKEPQHNSVWPNWERYSLPL
jgi:hypothetical protein